MVSGDTSTMELLEPVPFILGQKGALELIVQRNTLAQGSWDNLKTFVENKFYDLIETLRGYEIKRKLNLGTFVPEARAQQRQQGYQPPS